MKLSRYIEIKSVDKKQGGGISMDLTLLNSEITMKEVSDMEGS